MNKTVNDVKEFWNQNPLWSSESDSEIGTKEFFKEHRATYISNCKAGSFDTRFLPQEENRDYVLALGFGSGFWTVGLS